MRHPTPATAPAPVFNPVFDRTAETLFSPELNEDDIRDYSYHLYQQSNCAPGHDLDNWLEASACLKANIPLHLSHMRLHQHVNPATSSPQSAMQPTERHLVH